MAKVCNIQGFQASNGWLEKFKNRYCIASRALCGENQFVETSVIENFTESLNRKLEQYCSKNIFNLDETGLFFKLLSNRTLAVDSDKNLSNKPIKERVTVMFCVTWLEVSELTITNCFKKAFENALIQNLTEIEEIDDENFLIHENDQFDDENFIQNFARKLKQQDQVEEENEKIYVPTLYEASEYAKALEFWFLENDYEQRRKTIVNMMF
ncbi:tigger transposable element-derived protein 7-like [Octopus sinensis]|uniref:Tigger transposable element-derived protein 7-like n=1 Tax=Octopus sinensis TaxID=2607531 RepID=A0A6P7U3F0_9MOLL|nr:tigger transposable element-derived protein 7-like [Octopus sinensis]